jgi:hypothetical protein
MMSLTSNLILVEYILVHPERHLADHARVAVSNGDVSYKRRQICYL